MIRTQERRARRQADVTRQWLEDVKRAIAEHTPEPPDGILPWAHLARLACLHSVRDELRTELGLSLTGDAGRTA